MSEIVKKAAKLLKENILLILLILIMIVIGWKMTQTYWAFVDDGEMIEVSQRMNSTLGLLIKGRVFEWIKDPQVGRFRPVYWLFHYFVYVTFGLNRFWHGLSQLLILWTSGIMCYFTAKKISSSKIAGFLAGIFFVVNTLNQENWYRLGPQEAPMIFFFSISLYFLISYIFENVKADDLIIDFSKINKVFLKTSFKNIFGFSSKKDKVFYFLALVFAFFGYFSKENSLAFLVFPILLFAWSVVIKNKEVEFLRPKILFYLVFNLVMVILARYGAARNYVQGSYASDYIFSLANIKSNFIYYYSNIWATFEPILIIIFIYFLIKFIQFITDRKILSTAFFSGVVLTTFLSFFVIQLPWRYAVPRYLFPGMYFLAIFIGLSLDKVIQIIVNAKKSEFFKLTGLAQLSKTLLYGVWTLVAIVVIYNLATMSQYINRIYKLTNNFNRPLITELADKVGTGGRVVLDTPPGTAVELKQEIGLHLRLFFNRPDINVEYFEKAGSLNSKDVLLRAGELRQVSIDSKLAPGVLKNLKRIDIHVENKLYYPPMAFIQYYLPHVIISVLQGHTFSFDPVLASSADDYYWEIYDIN